jgi:hypothetical protein
VRELRSGRTAQAAVSQLTALHVHGVCAPALTAALPAIAAPPALASLVVTGAEAAPDDASPHEAHLQWHEHGSVVESNSAVAAAPAFGSRLAACRALTSLTFGGALGGSAPAYAAASQLATMTGIEALVLDGLNAYGAADVVFHTIVVPLTRPTQLRVLGCTPLTVHGYLAASTATLASLTRLRHLAITDATFFSYTPELMSACAELTNLMRLEVSTVGRSEHFDVLESLTQLVELDLHEALYEDNSACELAAAVVAMPRLRALALTTQAPQPSLGAEGAAALAAALRPLTCLTSLILPAAFELCRGSSGLNPEDIPSALLPQHAAALAHLDLSNCVLSAHHAAALAAALPELAALTHVALPRTQAAINDDSDAWFVAAGAGLSARLRRTQEHLLLALERLGALRTVHLFVPSGTLVVTRAIGWRLARRTQLTALHFAYLGFAASCANAAALAPCVGSLTGLRCLVLPVAWLEPQRRLAEGACSRSPGRGFTPLGLGLPQAAGEVVVGARALAVHIAPLTRLKSLELGQQERIRSGAAAVLATGLAHLAGCLRTVGSSPYCNCKLYSNIYMCLEHCSLPRAAWHDMPPQTLPDSPFQHRDQEVQAHAESRHYT